MAGRGKKKNHFLQHFKNELFKKYFGSSPLKLGSHPKSFMNRWNNESGETRYHFLGTQKPRSHWRALGEGEERREEAEAEQAWGSKILPRWATPSFSQDRSESICPQDTFVWIRKGFPVLQASGLGQGAGFQPSDGTSLDQTVRTSFDPGTGVCCKTLYESLNLKGPQSLHL